jgi:CRP/FNR family transcriptional regulator, cyclic AMP receptor protein
MAYFDMLAALPPTEREMLLGFLSRRAFAKGAEIISYRDASRSVFFILEGYARVVIYSADGRVVDFHEAGPGAAFGEVAAIDGLSRSASVIASSEVVAGVLSHADFRAMMARPAFAEAILLRLTSQVRSLIERIHDFSTLLVGERLVRELLRLAEREGGGDRGVIRRPPTHFDLAARISSHREAVSREMSRLAKRGLLKKVDRAVVIPSCAALEAETRGDEA